MPREEFEALSTLDFIALREAWESRERRADLRAARICWAASLASGVKRKDGSAPTVADFMPPPPGARDTRKEARAAARIREANLRAFLMRRTGGIGLPSAPA